MNLVNWWGSLENKFVLSDHSFTRLVAARWQDSMSRGQKSWIFFNFPHWFFVHFTMWRLLWIKYVSAKKIKGHRTSKIVKSRQSCSNGHLPYHCLFYYLARAPIHDVEWIFVRSKDAQKPLARTFLSRVIWHFHITGTSYLTELCVFWWFFTNEETFWCLS